MPRNLHKYYSTKWEVTQIKKELRSYIEAELRDYHLIKEELDELRDDILNESPLPPDGMPQGMNISDMTYSRVHKLLTCRQIRHLSRVYEGITAVLAILPPEKKKYVEVVYWTKPQTLNHIGLSMELSISPATFFKWKNEICEKIAKELGMQ